MISARAIEILRDERQKLLKVVAQIDAILQADGTVPAVTDERPRHDKPTGRRRGQQPRYDWETGRVMYESHSPVKEIADALSCSESAVKSAKKRYGWRRAARTDRRRPRSPTPRTPPPTSAISELTVTCPNCNAETSADPCGECHITLPKAVANRLATLMVNNGGRPA